MLLPDGLVSREEAARLVGVHVNTVKNWEKTGELRVERVKRGGRTYVGLDLRDVEALARDRGRGHQAEVLSVHTEEAELRTELRLLRERLEEVKAERDDLFRRLLDTRGD